MIKNLTHHDANVSYTHLPSFGHSLCFFAVDVSLYAGLSSGDENCVPKSQSSQSHSYCAKRTKHTWLNPLPIWQKQSAPSILAHTTDCRLYTTLSFELFNNKTAHFAIKGSYKTHLWHRLWLPLPVKKETHCLYKIEPFLPRTTQSPTARPEEILTDLLEKNKKQHFREKLTEASILGFWSRWSIQDVKRVLKDTLNVPSYHLMSRRRTRGHKDYTAAFVTALN